MSKADEFGALFIEEFRAREAQDKEQFRESWRSGGRAWTSIMLGPSADKNTSVLERTVRRLYTDPSSFSLHHNWYTIDLLTVRPAFANVPYWDTHADVLIEHENGTDVETEIWKLVHWRAPLKVLVFYQFRDSDWLKKKFDDIGALIKSANRKPTDEEYLLLAGYIKDSAIRWTSRTWRAGEETATNYDP